MAYHVVTTLQADQDIDRTIRWLKRKYSALTAAKWLGAISTAMDSLAEQPERCPLAVEDPHLSVQLRELVVRRYRGVTYRILFRITGDTVIIHRIRYAKRDSVKQSDL